MAASKKQSSKAPDKASTKARQGRGLTAPSRKCVYDAEKLKPIILNRLEAGDSLHTIAKTEGMPSPATVCDWLAKDSLFAEQYARAREAQADKMAAEILAIADTPVIGVKTKTNEKGEVETTEGDMIEHRRLQVDARKWLAARMAPKKYGDKVENTVTGPDGGPVKHSVKVEFI